MKFFNEDPITKKKIGSPYEQQEPIAEYTIPITQRPIVNFNEHKGGSVNFFTYDHPTVTAPGWFHPCFEGKQIAVPVRPFNKNYKL